MVNLAPDFIGYQLLKRPFKDWFLYMFRVIEGQPFVIDKIHNDMFDFFQDIIDGKENRCVLSLPPRAGKTTLSKYFLVYGLTLNPKSNFIYCSYSQSLLNTIALEIQNILESPLYKAMYPQNTLRFEEEETTPIDDYWLSYLKKDNGKNTYSSKKIVTYAGGICIFNSIGSSITGFGFSTRNTKKFSGALIIDDPQKMADIHSKVLKKKCLLYFEETLLSRANNPNAPIVCVQQRAALDDLSGYLIEKYKFYNLKKPLLDDNGECQISSQYTPERIEELKLNNYMFQSQYMQQPIFDGGNVIKREWFKYYPTNCKYDYKRLIITADTAMKVKEHNDYSVFVVAGITNDNKLHILDVIRGKWEAPDLKKIAIQTFERFKYNSETGLCCSGLYIEDKASGVGLIQDLQREGIPVIGMQVHNDKLTRIEEILTYIEAGQVLLPNDENYSFVPNLLSETDAFSRDDSHLHDDQCDAIAYAVKQGLAKGNVSLLDYFME